MTQAQPEVMVETKPAPRAVRWSPPSESTHWRVWLDRFEKEHGRPPRILHIGNVANNGYNNAKVLVEAGFDCDALCYDYYHIMGCPEWEDGDFHGMVSDHFFPHWGQVDLNGFRRPLWFAQGPRLWAIAYLLAKHDRRARCTRFLWRMLAVQRWLVAHRDQWWYRSGKATARRMQYELSRINAAACRVQTFAGRQWSRTVHTLAVIGQRSGLTRGTAALTHGFDRTIIKSRHAITKGHAWQTRIMHRANTWVWPMPFMMDMALYFAKFPLFLVALALALACLPFALLYHSVGWLGGMLTGTARARGKDDTTQTPRQDSASWFRRVRPMPWHAFSHRVRARVFRRLTGIDLDGLAPSEFMTSFYARADELIADFGRRFPDRSDQLTLMDMLPYLSVLPLWRELFSRYDLVEAYATDPILTMLAGYEPCVAYEHGTIREIPFHDSPTARLTALAYARSQAVVITNPDCREAAIELGVDRFVPIPHLIDRKYYNPMIADAGDLPSQIRPPYIFSPARHDWDIKGTHILLGAFARIAAEFPDLQLVTPSWGGDLDRSRDLIESLGMTGRVAMIEPVNIHNLIRVTRGARVLIDQFRFGVFGGIGPTALAVGTPLITHLDHTKSDWWMEPPPYFEAWDEVSCVDALRRALTSDAGALRASLRAWMRRNYWHGQVVDRHASLFADLIEHTRTSTTTDHEPSVENL